MSPVSSASPTPPRAATPPPVTPRSPRPASTPTPGDEKAADATPPPATPANATDAGPRVRAVPRRVPVEPGFPKLRPSAANERLAARINAMLPRLTEQLAPALHERTGWHNAVDQVEVELVDRAGLRAMLRTQEGYGLVAAFFLSWVMPVVYAPSTARVMVVAPTARRYGDATLHYQLTRALVMGAVARKHRDFYGYVSDRIGSALQRPHDVYSCRAWAQALGECVANASAPKGRRGPWWQRLGMFALWPFALYTVGPHRLARRFVPILEEAVRDPAAGPALVDRMFAFPSLCHALYDAPGKRVLTFEPQAGYRYKRQDFGADVRYLKQFNPHAGATYYTVED